MLNIENVQTKRLHRSKTEEGREEAASSAESSHKRR